VSDPAAAADAYFKAVASRDVEGIRRAFAPDAELVTAAGRYRGPDQIAGFYRDLVFGARVLEPRPGPYVVEGRRLAVEIELRMDDSVSSVADFFTVSEEGLIERLAIYMGPQSAS